MKDMLSKDSSAGPSSGGGNIKDLQRRVKHYE
jgi:hypothetical protein